MHSKSKHTALAPHQEKPKCQGWHREGWDGGEIRWYRCVWPAQVISTCIISNLQTAVQHRRRGTRGEVMGGKTMAGATSIWAFVSCCRRVVVSGARIKSLLQISESLKPILYRASNPPQTFEPLHTFATTVPYHKRPELAPRTLSVITPSYDSWIVSANLDKTILTSYWKKISSKALWRSLLTAMSEVTDLPFRDDVYIGLWKPTWM